MDCEQLCVRTLSTSVMYEIVSIVQIVIVGCLYEFQVQVCEIFKYNKRSKDLGALLEASRSPGAGGNTCKLHRCSLILSECTG